MMMNRLYSALSRLACLSVCVLAFALSPMRPANAQAYPSRPITLVVSFEPGGSTDISARAVAQELSAVLGQPVVVDNKPGAGGRIGTKYAALAKADGYTLLWGSGSTLTAGPVLYPDQGHVAGMAPISLGATQPFVFVTTPATGAKTLAEFVALAKRRPGELNFASAGTGSSNHLLGEIFMSATGIQLVHVPYKGAASAKEGLLKGDAQLMDEVVSPLIGALRANQLVPLFITSDTRDRLFPSIPTAAEVGLPDLAITGFFGLLAPGGTPPEVLTRLNGAMKKALAAPAVSQAFDNLGFTAAYSAPEEMQARIAQGKATYQRVVSERKIKVD
ncbi:Bug family tripartite tricarboxylate transporter substrate binding protein [Variovorax sp. RT4R15]|uniref:Bug family tripartite tricarboxylate transporter substrate binding protein n=1 Tax=Variovorax sp. RT4R15 TaxID=3443737 RepID=UPI003F47FD8B